MAAESRNEFFHVLDDFVCEAIHAPSALSAGPGKAGRAEGISVVEELLVDFRPNVRPGRESPESSPDSGTPSASELEVPQEAIQHLRTAVADLPQDYRDILLMRLNGMSVLEISASLGITPPVAWRKLSQILGELSGATGV